MEANQAYGVRLAALRLKAQQFDELVKRLDNPPNVHYGYVGDLGYINELLNDLLGYLGEHADAIEEVKASRPTVDDVIEMVNRA